MKKKIITLMVVAMISSIGFVGCTQGNAETKNAVAVASVDGQSITEEEFNSYVEFQKKGAENSGKIAPEMWTEDAGKGNSFEQELKLATLEYLVTQDILLQAADKDKVVVTDEEIVSEFQKIKDSFEDEAQFKDYLEKMGTSEDYMKTLIQDRLVINKYLESSVNVEDVEVEKYYEENKAYFDKIRASHILVKLEKDADGNMDEALKTKALEKIKDIQSKLNTDKTFEEIAVEYSEGPSAPAGGDLGYFGKGQMVKEFEDVAFSLETGKVSEPVLSQFGYHLIKVTDKKMDFASNIDDVKKLFTEKAYSEKMKELTESAKVEKYLSFEKEKAEETEKVEEAKVETETPVEKVEETETKAE